LIDFQSHIFDALAPNIAKFYPYLFSNFDTLLHNGIPKVIDINGVVNNLNFSQVPQNVDPDLYFRYFVSRITSLQNSEEIENQLRYWTNIKLMYQKLRDLGPAFISGDKIVVLDEMKEYSIKKYFDL